MDDQSLLISFLLIKISNNLLNQTIKLSLQCMLTHLFIKIKMNNQINFHKTIKHTLK
jgi:hypothetical protein